MHLESESIQFDFDKASLRENNRELPSRITGVFLTSRDCAVYVYGHTDDIGSDEHNLTLSGRRAQSVRDYLVEAGINPKIITTKGFGQSRPMLPGTSSEIRAKNRRMEIGIVDTLVAYQGAVTNRKQ